MPIQRRATTQVAVGHMTVGSDHPIVVQSMVNTPTADIDATVSQIQELVAAGSELVRLTIADDAAAKSVIVIDKKLANKGIQVPLIGDFHFNGHQLLKDHPDMAKALAKYRMNPGNVGRGNRHDARFVDIIKVAVEYQKPVRIGVNGGSLDPDLFSEQMEQNAKRTSPKTTDEIFCDTMIQSALQSAWRAIELGLKDDQIILSAKTSNIPMLVMIYQELGRQCAFPLHLGLTEAGAGEQGIISSSVGMGILLQQGIGDTLRVSLTPEQDSSRSKEVAICRHILQSLGIRHFQPKVISCPGCGRTSSADFQQMVHDVRQHIQRRLPDWQKCHSKVNEMTVAVMGCVVNGPGESRHADIGISLPGSAEQPAAPVYIHGKLFTTLRGRELGQQFLVVLDEFVKRTY